MWTACWTCFLGCCDECLWIFDWFCGCFLLLLVRDFIVLHNFLDPGPHFSRCSVHFFCLWSLMLMFLLRSCSWGSAGFSFLTLLRSSISLAVSLGTALKVWGILSAGICFLATLFIILCKVFSLEWTLLLMIAFLNRFQCRGEKLPSWRYWNWCRFCFRIWSCSCWFPFW